MLALGVFGCGGSTSDQALVFPAGHDNYGSFYVPVATRAQADPLCAATDQWPAEYPDQVTFDLPDTGSDLTCLRP